jgi:hypothetical protein
MEFLDINITKDSSLLLHAITVSSTSGFFLLLPQKNPTESIFYFGFKKPHQKIRKTGTSLFMTSILWTKKKKGRKPDKNSILRGTEFMPKILD